MTIEEFVEARTPDTEIAVDGIVLYYRAEQVNRVGRVITPAMFGFRPAIGSKIRTSGTWPASKTNERIIRAIYSEIED